MEQITSTPHTGVIKTKMLNIDRQSRNLGLLAVGVLGSELGNGEAETDGTWLRCSFPVLEGNSLQEFWQSETGLASKGGVEWP